MLKLLDRRRREEEGFTLIELMVVVLILGILMAIAIPTFLATTKSANDVSAQTNATNAATSELSNNVNQSTFIDSANGANLDPAIPWVSGTTPASGKVLVEVGSTWAGLANGSGSTGQIMLLESLASDGNCFIVYSDQALTTPVTGYLVTTGGCPTISAEPNAQVTGGNGAAKGANRIASSSYAATTTWYTSW